MKLLAILLSLLSLSLSLYNADSAVFKLTADNFKKQVLESDDIWLVEFYAPWCGHCKSTAPEYQKAAEILEGIVRVGAVDMTTDGPAGQPYGVSGYPTIKLFTGNKHKPVDYQGGRDFESFVKYCTDSLKKQLTRRQKQEASTYEQL